MPVDWLKLDCVFSFGRRCGVTGTLFAALNADVFPLSAISCC